MNKKTIIITVVLLGVLIGGAIFIYQLWQTKGDMGGQIEENEELTEQVEELQKEIGELKISGENSVFRYPDSIWQFKNESPYGFYVDGQLIHRELEKCDAWLGTNGHEICMAGEEDCDAIIEEESIQLNDKRFFRRWIWRVKKQQVEYILVHYDIFREEVLFYGIELYTTPTDKEQCINDFEQVLETFEPMSL